VYVVNCATWILARRMSSLYRYHIRIVVVIEHYINGKRTKPVLKVFQHPAKRGMHLDLRRQGLQHKVPILAVSVRVGQWAMQIISACMHLLVRTMIGSGCTTK